MSLSILLLIGMVVMYACGVYMLLERSVTRIILAVLLIGNATNLLMFLVSGRFGTAPITSDEADPAEFSDPLPQAFILTAIVITFATSAFMLALLYRSWRLSHSENDPDDGMDVDDTDPATGIAVDEDAEDGTGGQRGASRDPGAEGAVDGLDAPSVPHEMTPTRPIPVQSTAGRAGGARADTSSRGAGGAA